MSTLESPFYVTGGTLRQDAACYVERQADKDLLDGLLHGEFCYVLTSRQMGKSSLMVRTAGKLREQGVRVVVLDLTAIGQNLTPEQWYDGLLVRLGRQLDLEDELEEFWETHRQLGPCQRLFAALRDVVLASSSRRQEAPTLPDATAAEDQSLLTSAATARRLVLFVDELDVVRSLPFSTDEFFAAIRECYNRRTEDAEFNRLTFCLLGVATPSDLIRDTRTTPFNIGQRIVLNDFTPEEAAPLAKGLAPQPSTLNPQLLLERILHWTNGHPYLTQRLCQAVAEGSSRREEAHAEKPETRNPKPETDQSLLTSAATAFVDELCAELFFSPRAREQDDNLLFVRERLLRSEADLATLLHFYEPILARKRVPDDETNPLVSVLRLSGVARGRNGCLEGRNRIYERVFDRSWLRTNMPDAELRRQRMAFRQGVLRAACLGAVILSVIAVLALMAAHQAAKAQRNAESERRARRTAEERLYASDMNVAHLDCAAGNLGRARALLEAHRPRPGQEEERGFEWRYLWGLAQEDSLATIPCGQRLVFCVTHSPDGQMLATAGLDQTVKLWDVATRKELAVLRGHGDRVMAVAFSPDGKLLATGGWNKTVRIWDVASRMNIASLEGFFVNSAHGLAFSPDGRLLAVAGHSETNILLWDVGQRRDAGILQGHRELVYGLAFAPDGLALASGSADKTIRLWSVRSRISLATLEGHRSTINSVAFSPDGRRLVSASSDETVKVWNLASGREAATLHDHTMSVSQAAFSRDGALLISASLDSTLRVWQGNESQNGPRLQVARHGHRNSVFSISLSPDGHTLASSSKDGTVRLWDLKKKPEAEMLQTSVAESLALSRDGRLLAAGGKDLSSGNPVWKIELWDVKSHQLVRSLIQSNETVFMIAFSPDGKALVSTRRSAWKMTDVASGAEWPTQQEESQVGATAFSPNGRWLAIAQGSGFGGSIVPGAIRILEVASQKTATILRGHEGAVRHIAFSPDSKSLASASADQTVRIWDIPSGAHLHTFKPISDNMSDWINCVAFSQSGQLLAAGDYLGVVTLFDLKQRKEVQQLRAHVGATFSVAFSPDDKTLASGGLDKCVNLWNVATGQLLLTFRHPNQIGNVTFASDGSALFAGGVADGPTDRGSGHPVAIWRAPAFSDTDFEMAKQSK